MPVYAYKALDTALSTVRGAIAADTPRQAREQLRLKGLSVEELRERSAGFRRYAWFQTPNRFESRLVPAIRELSTLLSASVLLVDALRTVSSQQRGTFGTALAIVCDRVSAGLSLADAMREHPHIFDTLTIHMVDVGENAGNLETVLDQVAEFRDRYLQFKDRVLTAMFYPLFVLATSLIVIMFLMTFVVPMLLDNLIDAGKSIPWPTQILKGASDLLQQYGLALGLAAIAAVVGAIAFVRTPIGRRTWHRVLLKLPILGNLSEKQELARASLIIATLMESGIVFLEALAIATRAVRNTVLQDALRHVHDRVQTGADIGEAMSECSIFPPTAVQVYSVGQQTGKLESMLHRLATDYDRQVSRLSARLGSILEPLMIVFLAVFVGFILYATMLPILEAGNVL